LTLQWLAVAAALLVGAAGLIKARRATKRLERLTESYWELKYEQGQLRARLARLEPPDPPAADPARPPTGAGQSFVPLSSLRGPR
jgi:hypothetical protein